MPFYEKNKNLVIALAALIAVGIIAIAHVSG
jgi:hypothetical protein